MSDKLCNTRSRVVFRKYKLDDFIFLNQVSLIPYIIEEDYDEITSGIYEGECVFIGGFKKISPSVVELWLFMSDKAKTIHIIPIEIKNYILQSRFKYIRIQAIIRNSDEKLHRWITWLGFVCEGILKRYFNGEDFAMYRLD